MTTRLKSIPIVIVIDIFDTQKMMLVTVITMTTRLKSILIVIVIYIFDTQKMMCYHYDYKTVTVITMTTRLKSILIVIVIYIFDTQKMMLVTETQTAGCCPQQLQMSGKMHPDLVNFRL